MPHGSLAVAAACLAFHLYANLQRSAEGAAAHWMPGRFSSRPREGTCGAPFSDRGIALRFLIP